MIVGVVTLCRCFTVYRKKRRGGGRTALCVKGKIAASPAAVGGAIEVSLPVPDLDVGLIHQPRAIRHLKKRIAGDMIRIA